jgi:hypothetical protein
MENERSGEGTFHSLAKHSPAFAFDYPDKSLCGAANSCGLRRPPKESSAPDEVRKGHAPHGCGRQAPAKGMLLHFPFRFIVSKSRNFRKPHDSCPIHHSTKPIRHKPLKRSRSRCSMRQSYRCVLERSRRHYSRQRFRDTRLHSRYSRNEQRCLSGRTHNRHYNPPPSCHRMPHDNRLRRRRKRRRP